MASKPTSLSVSVRTCESVAQKLFIQCRDSGSTYKSLTGSLRTLRNVLGELDEGLDDNSEQQDDAHLPCGISKCEALLLKLEAALVLSRCSNQCEVNAKSIASFTIDLDSTTRELITAYQKMTRTDVLSPTIPQDALSTLRRESQSSKTSSTCSATNKDTPGDTCSSRSTAPAIRSTKRQSRSNTEKEVFHPEQVVYHHYHPDRANKLQRSSSQASLQSKGSSNNARPDPILGSPFEAACGLIHNDDTLVGQMAELEPSWIPSAELEGYDTSPTPRTQQLAEIDVIDMIAGHSRKDSLLGDVESNTCQRTKTADEHVEMSPPKVLDQDDYPAHSSAAKSGNDQIDATPCGLTATAGEDEAISSNSSGRDTESFQGSPEAALPTVSNRAQAAQPPRPPPPTPANTQVGSNDLAQATILPARPEAVAQSTALPESDSEDDLYDSTPVLRPVPDEDMPIPPPLVVKKTISEVEDVITPTPGSAAEDATTSEDSTTEAESLREEKIEANEREDDAPEMVQVKKRHVPMKSNSVADIKQTLPPPRDDKETWLSSRGASRYHAAARTPSAPPAVTFQPATTKFPISRNEHDDVTCDVCDQKIFGKRHKCLDCADWDHCDECIEKARPMHPEHHRFVALDQPVAPWPEDVLDATADEYLKSLPNNTSKAKLIKKSRSAQPVSNGTPKAASRRTAPVPRAPVAYAESPDFVGDVHHRTFYGPGGIDEATPTELLDDERVKLIVHFFNVCDWERAEKFLIGHLDSLVARSVENSTWNEAIKRFITVLKAPIKSVADIDDGDCAAAHWLGDLYAMQNRRAEALLAYSIAERSSIFNRSDSSFRRATQAEQAAVQIGVSKADFKQYWSLEGESADPTSIPNKDIVSIAAAKQVLASPSVAFDDASEETSRHRRSSNASSPLRQDRPRASYMSTLDHGAPQSNIWDSDLMKITHWSFLPNSAWPMPFDPLISLANIERGRLYAYECDMLEVFEKNPEAKIPRPSLLVLNKVSSCFTHPDLKWLITHLRTHLHTTSISHSEIVNIHGTYLCCRYPVTHTLPNHSKIVATMNYFTISIFRHPLPSKGYGVEIITDDGMSSARIARVDEEWVKGAHVAETKRVRSCIRAALEEAAMRERVQRQRGGGKDVEKEEDGENGSGSGKTWWREGWVCK